MPIKTVEEKQSMPVIGKIRLGIRKEAASGAQYPSTVEHFVLTDAPEVAKVYGEDPKELDVMFPGDDKEQVIPTWLKWFAGGVKGKDGNIIGGKLQCYGDGPNTEGAPGLAHFLAKRDPITRVAPTRPCKGPECPDWHDKNGNPQCKQAMNVFVILPRVSWFGVYQIDTTSWNSIRSFHQQVDWIRKLNNGVIRMIPFKLVREEKATTFYDVKAGKEKQGKQFIMMLKPNQGFLDKHGEEMKQRVALAFKASEQYLLPAPQEILEKPMEDNYPTGEQKAALPEPPKIDFAAIAETPALSDLFKAVAAAKGVKNTPKLRMLTAKKFEADPNPLQALATYLNEQVNAIKKAPEPAEPTPPPVAQQPAQQPVAQDSGLI